MVIRISNATEASTINPCDLLGDNGNDGPTHLAEIGNQKFAAKAPLPPSHVGILNVLDKLKADTTSVDESAKLFLGEVHDSIITRIKVRCLYDIANVLSSLNLTEKVHSVTGSVRLLGVGVELGMMEEPWGCRAFEDVEECRIGTRVTECREKIKRTRVCHILPHVRRNKDVPAWR